MNKGSLNAFKYQYICKIDINMHKTPRSFHILFIPIAVQLHSPVL